MKVPSKENEQRCFDIRCRSKSGKYVCQEDHDFCQKMWREYTEWYKLTEHDVFEATKPFGTKL